MQKLIGLTAYIVVVFCFSDLFYNVYADPRPLFLLGHMANCESGVLEFLNLGANAIETDVTFTYDGIPSFNYHGFPCDCFRFCFWSQKFESYLESIKKIVNFQTNKIIMLYLDLKVEFLNQTALMNAGKFLAKYLIEHLLQGTDLENLPLIILGVPDVNQLSVLESFEKNLIKEKYAFALKLIGYDAYNSKMKLEELLLLINSKNITKHLFIGDGYTNCFMPAYQRLGRLVKIRDDCNSTCPDGVFHWTIDGPDNQRNTLRLGVDGIITNRPETVIKILNEDEFCEKYRLADLGDIPWEY